MALAGKQLRESNGLVSAIDPLAAELRFEGVRRLMRRAQIGVNKDHRMGQHHVAAASRQRALPSDMCRRRRGRRG